MYTALTIAGSDSSGGAGRKQKNSEFKHAFGKSRSLRKDELQRTVSFCALH